MHIMYIFAVTKATIMLKKAAIFITAILVAVILNVTDRNDRTSAAVQYSGMTGTVLDGTEGYLDRNLRIDGFFLPGSSTGETFTSRQSYSSPYSNPQLQSRRHTGGANCQNTSITGNRIHDIAGQFTSFETLHGPSVRYTCRHHRYHIVLHKIII